MSQFGFLGQGKFLTCIDFPCVGKVNEMSLHFLYSFSGMKFTFSYVHMIPVLSGHHAKKIQVWGSTPVVTWLSVLVWKTGVAGSIPSPNQLVLLANVLHSFSPMLESTESGRQGLQKMGHKDLPISLIDSLQQFTYLLHSTCN